VEVSMIHVSHSWVFDLKNLFHPMRAISCEKLQPFFHAINLPSFFWHVWFRLPLDQYLLCP
jgi:hypothetical protein